MSGFSPQTGQKLVSIALVNKPDKDENVNNSGLSSEI